MFCLLGYGTSSFSGCLPPKDEESLGRKSEPIGRFLLLAEIGERQASRLVHLSYPVQPLKSVPFPKRPTPNEILDLHDCACSQLLDDLFHWKSHRPCDADAIQQIEIVLSHVLESLPHLYAQLLVTSQTNPEDG
jgi:hypothetical protein